MTTSTATYPTVSGGPLTYKQLGEILLREVGEEGCLEGYLTTDPEWVGRYGLQYGDIRRDGELN